MVQKLGQYPLLYQPGTKWHYSVSTDVLGYLIERVSQESLGEFFQRNIFEPLHMKDTSFSVSEEQLLRFSSSYGPHQKLVESYLHSPYKNTNRIQSGGGGLVSTATDYMHFCQMLLNKGIFGGKRILQKQSIEEMTKNQLPERVFAYGVFGFGLGFRYSYKIGDIMDMGEYGWNGAANTFGYPKDELIVIALSQRQPYSEQLKKTLKPIVYKQSLRRRCRQSAASLVLATLFF